MRRRSAIVSVHEHRCSWYSFTVFIVFVQGLRGVRLWHPRLVPRYQPAAIDESDGDPLASIRWQSVSVIETYKSLLLFSPLAHDHKRNKKSKS